MLLNSGLPVSKLQTSQTESQAFTELAAFVQGLARYHQAPDERRRASRVMIWQQGSSILWRYGAADGLPMLVIPSLVNKPYILDLKPQRSMLSYCAANGITPYLLEWGAPTTAEKAFDITDYVVRRLEPALHRVRQMQPQRVILLGYCMGGMLALALAQRRLADVAKLVLLATPWDMHHACSAGQRVWLQQLMPWLQTRLANGMLDVDTLQALLASIDPFSVVQRFTRLGKQAEDTLGLGQFAAVEDWLNDGVPLVSKVATECLFSWYLHNTPMQGLWEVAGVAVSPKTIPAPVLVVAATGDTIVPPAASQPLLEQLPQAHLLQPAQGHIGMVAGRYSEQVLWQPLTAWCRQPADHAG